MEIAVFDVETTGFGHQDRVVQIGIMTIDARTGRVTSEYETLIDPKRDTGRPWIHHITNEMVADAPYFEDVAADLRELLHGRVLVAHNLPFDLRMITAEYKRFGVQIDPGVGICTYKLTKQKLNVACAERGINLVQHHDALSDVRATAELLFRMYPQPRGKVARIGRIQ